MRPAQTIAVRARTPPLFIPSKANHVLRKQPFSAIALDCTRKDSKISSRQQDPACAGCCAQSSNGTRLFAKSHNNSNALAQPLKGSYRLKKERGADVRVQAGVAATASGTAGSGQEVNTWARKIILGLALTYVGVMVILPFANVFYQAFAPGIVSFAQNFWDVDFLHALKLTLMLAAFTVPLNTFFGIIAAINITRNDFPGKVFLLSLLDLPFSISPVVTGLMLVLLYGRVGWFAQILQQYNVQIVFAFPGMLLATLFVTFPFVVREVIPVLEAMDVSEEEAARTLGASEWQVFWNVTLPSIRWALLYGVILTDARAMGEFGAVSVISGNILGKTQTLTLFVESSYKEYNTPAAFAAAVLLSFLALLTLFIKEKVESIAAAEASS